MADRRFSSASAHSALLGSSSRLVGLGSQPLHLHLSYHPIGGHGAEGEGAGLGGGPILMLTEGGGGAGKASVRIRRSWFGSALFDSGEVIAEAFGFLPPICLIIAGHQVFH